MIAPPLWKIGSTITAAISAGCLGEQLLEAGGVVVLARQHLVARRSTLMPARLRDRGGSVRGPGLCRVEAHAPVEIVVPAVVVALELDDPRPAGVDAGHADRVVGDLGTEAGEDDPLRARNGARQALGELQLERVRRREGHAPLVEGLDDRLAQAWIVVAEQDGAETAMEVDVAIPVDILDVRTLCPRERERERGRRRGSRR